jgi:hypothetical protein
MRSSSACSTTLAKPRHEPLGCVHALIGDVSVAAAVLLLLLLHPQTEAEAAAAAAASSKRPAPELEDTGVVGERAIGKGECCAAVLPLSASQSSGSCNVLLGASWRCHGQALC